MAYRFKLDEKLGKSLRRIGAEQIEQARAELTTGEGAPAVHASRKCIKRLRALLRLVRPNIGKSAYRHLNTTLGDAGRALSGSRDRDVLLATIAELKAEAKEHRAALDALAAGLDRDNAAGAAGQPELDRAEADRLLAEVAVGWQHLELAGKGGVALTAGLEKGMKALHDGLAGCSEDDDESYHELRKAVQRHWRQMRLLHHGWPDFFGARAEEARTISDQLGKAQDLTLLVEHLRAAGPGILTKKRLAALEAMVKARRTAWRDLARVHCLRLTAESPHDLALEAAAYWSAARKAHKQGDIAADEAPSTADSGGAPPVKQAAARARRAPSKRQAPRRPSKPR